jgi:hypothetical protein
MESYSLRAMLSTKSIVAKFNKSCAHLENSVVEAEPEVMSRIRAALFGQFGPRSPTRQGLWRVDRDAVERAKRRRETRESVKKK